ncbi:hypothetical protein ABT56_05765 [Photobacterium aquae]|uniref:Flagellar assembly protein T N-terminal domain-containing protein n=2 Tax=Photobacterium aquae TaxID=1195763 RepID=A0A0J1H6C7_9GAMM|nr:hypothetical protein ABT56_05765 [Photobacterium aquae]
MKKLLRNILKTAAVVIASSTMSVPVIAEPMDDVFTLFDMGGGTISGRSAATGYYVVAMGLSDRSNETKGLEEARIDALRKLNEMINGVTMSGSSSASMEYITVSAEEDREFSKESFVDVVNTRFSGSLSAVKELKSGKYDGSYFVAMLITESDVNKISKLRASSSHSGVAGNTIIIANGSDGASIAQAELKSEFVEAKGLADMKHGEAEARKLALTNALHNAIQQVQGVMLQGKSGKFNDAIALAISTKSEGYVSGYELLDEDIARGQYYVIIEAEVNSGKLLNDVSFYTKIFGQPVFDVHSENSFKTDWLVDELERLGFSINDGKTKSTHSFYLNQKQKSVENHKGVHGIETAVSVELKDNQTGEILFTVTNDPLKSRIYVDPISRSKQVSEHVAYKQLKNAMGVEIIQSLARHAEKGMLYQIVLKNAKRTDVELFKHVLNNGSGGQVEGWNWNKNGKVMILDFRYSGPLSEAFDQSLNEIYRTFKQEGKGRRPHAETINNRTAEFKIITS